MKKYNNINEEISRMKSLFGESNLYGNLLNEEIEEKKHLVVEQKWMKNLLFNTAKNTDAVLKKLRVAVKSVDDAMATKFLNYRVANVGDMVAYLDTFPNIWRTALGEQGFNRLKQSMVALNDPNYVKRVQDLYNTDPKKGAMFLDAMGNGLPIEVRPLFDELANASIAGKDIDDVIDTAQVVVIKKGDETTIHTIAPDGTVIKSNSIDEAGDLIEPDVKTKTNAQTDVNTKLGKDTKGTGGSKSTKEIEIDPNDNPDNIKGEILEGIEDGMDDAIKGGTGTKINLGNLQKRLKEEKKVLMKKNPDGSTTEVTEIEIVEVTVDETGNVVGEAVIKKETIERIKEDGGTPIKPDTDGGKKPPTETGTKRKVVDTLKSTPNFIRWMFPTMSTVGRVTIGWLPVVKNFWRGKRFSFAELIWPGKTGKWYAKGVTVGENAGRILFVEPIFLVGIVGAYSEYKRGGLDPGESRILQYIDDYMKSWLSWFHPVTLLAKGITLAYENAPDITAAGYKKCRSDVEKIYQSKVESGEITGFTPDQISKSQEFTDCKKKVDAFVSNLNNIGTILKEISEDINVGDWNEEKITNFCEDKPKEGESEGRKTKLFDNIDRLIVSMESTEGSAEDIVDIGQGIGFANKIISVLDYLTPVGLDKLTDIKSQMDELKGESGEVTVSSLNKIKEDIEKKCMEYFSKKNRKDVPDYVDPNTTPEDTIPQNTIDQDYIDDIYGCEDDVSFQINIIPINIIDEDMG